MSSVHPLWPAPLEVASGFPTGEHPGAAPLPVADGQLAPLEALERATLPALTHPPCVVTFSGGRDSSTVLAVAARVARREGLPLPIPTTQRYCDAPQADESRWQEIVIRHVGVEEWHRVDVTDELDLVGPVSRSVLRRHGLLWPPNSYVHDPMLEATSGGSLMTGIEGDGLLSGWRWQRAADAWGRRRRPEAKDLARLAYSAAPKNAKRMVERRRADLKLEWLREGARRAVIESWAAERAEEPVRWDRRVGWWARRRYLAMSGWALGLLAADHDVRLSHPLLDPPFLATVARAGGRFGFGDRTAAMRAMFATVLPDEVLARADKAAFSQAFWREGTRAFVDCWDGSGVDHELVDEAALRAVWATAGEDFRSAMPLLAAFLASARHEIDETLGNHR